MRRAEWHTRQRKERARKQAGFLANPFGLTKQQLGQKRSGHLTCPKDEIDHHLRETLSDEARDLDLGHCKALIIPPAPGRRPRRGSRKQEQAQPQGRVGYLVGFIKNCPWLLNRLWRILKVIWRRDKVAYQWRYAEGVWIQKEEESKNINQVRTISLLSVELSWSGMSSGKELSLDVPFQ